MFGAFRDKLLDGFKEFVHPPTLVLTLEDRYVTNLSPTYRLRKRRQVDKIFNGRGCGDFQWVASDQEVSR